MSTVIIDNAKNKITLLYCYEFNNSGGGGGQVPIRDWTFGDLIHYPFVMGEDGK